MSDLTKQTGHKSTILLLGRRHKITDLPKLVVNHPCTSSDFVLIFDRNKCQFWEIVLDTFYVHTQSFFSPIVNSLLVVTGDTKTPMNKNINP